MFPGTWTQALGRLLGLRLRSQPPWTVGEVTAADGALEGLCSLQSTGRIQRSCPGLAALSPPSEAQGPGGEPLALDPAVHSCLLTLVSLGLGGHGSELSLLSQWVAPPGKYHRAWWYRA